MWTRQDEKTMQASLRHRRSARVLLFDELGRVLLIRFAVSRDGTTFIFWATPGGGVEEGESELSTARREVYEELHVSVDLRGPVHTSGDRFEHEGILVENTDVFFVGRCSADAPRLDGLTEAERAVMKAAKWWAIEEIENSDETIFPPDLGAMVRHFA